MDGYGAPGTEAYGDAATTDSASGWYEGSATEATTEQSGFSIPTTNQTNGGGPMRQNRGTGSRYNPMSRGKPGGDTGPASAATAEKNELGYIIFAYNIGYQTDEAQLHSLFQPYGTVAKVNVIQDFATGQGKGFGFVTMPNGTEAEAAVNTLNGTDFNGNTLQVRFKSPKGAGPPSRVRGAGFRGARGGFRGARGAPRGGAFRGGGYTGYDSYSGGYSDPSGYGSYDYAADPYAGYGSASGAGYASYGTGGW
ncbi:uncharacterized protein [Watersipora subatra]|uniref:uncharacterized protein isoform X2 n=1 Tax=Watersipora subatra TaxID=2589382 RepID=UPI00355BAF62